MNSTTILEMFNDPQMRHAALVHMPIALSAIALLAAVVSAIFLKNTTLRCVTFTGYALLLLTAILAVRSGEAAEAETGQLVPDVYHVLEEHEEMAEKVWMFALVTALLVAASSIPKKRVRLTASWLAVAGGLATAGWLGATAHHGGDLVYGAGVGMPSGAGAASTGSASDDARIAFFTTEVRPILESECMGCHNPGGKGIPAGLDLTSIATILRGGETGPAVVPGDPDGSLLLRAVRYEIEDLEMPPPPKNDRLGPEDIARLEQWVRDGAVWDGVMAAP
ncbi:MAG: hypothetical protein GY715_13750 [Planctomycetes bacterium]|nr:hypothetical protein [Planctomycetota bacterium]